ncbi:MAG: hypothetical protein J7498_08245 [Sphingobium sp.]|nr:hypothetical protein [Sphingobium sp.]
MTMWKAMALLATGFAVPATAQVSTQVAGDLRCITILSAATATVPENQRPQMAAIVLYFIGRVDGAAPGLDLTAEIKRIVPTLGALNVGDEAKRCAAILTEKGAQLQDVGKALQEEGKAQGAK